MAVDRTLDLRPGVIDIADNVDDIITMLTPTVLTASDLTFSSEFEQYSTSAQNRVNITVIAGMVFLSGAVKPVVEIPSTGEHVIATLPASCRPQNQKYFVCQGSQRNVYTLIVKTNGEITLSRYGTTAYTKCPAGAFIRIECAYTIY